MDSLTFLNNEKLWISKSGNLIQVPSSYTHQTYIRFLGSNFDNIEDVYKSGWARVAGVGAEIYICKPKFILNEELEGLSSCQISAIMDLCLLIKKEKLIYDNNEEERVIWSSDEKI